MLNKILYGFLGVVLCVSFASQALAYGRMAALDKKAEAETAKTQANGANTARSDNFYYANLMQNGGNDINNGNAQIKSRAQIRSDMIFEMSEAQISTELQNMVLDLYDAEVEDGDAQVTFHNGMKSDGDIYHAAGSTLIGEAWDNLFDVEEDFTQCYLDADEAETNFNNAYSSYQVANNNALSAIGFYQAAEAIADDWEGYIP